ncbi:hemin uptake protein HemP [Luteimonas abyssi]|uniref:hemin uptake protein HemP n=1 Tax=Luteimonas abyssi TaxID=1247514 RepID=UPI000737AFB8|nr:hemin uptake protein HemP [Luteimonas abyssi]
MFVARTHEAAPAESASVSHLTPVPWEVVLDSRRLLNGQREIRIRHGNEVYRLRHTRNDKLILTK